jgi:hypothetical protein
MSLGCIDEALLRYEPHDTQQRSLWRTFLVMMKEEPISSEPEMAKPRPMYLQSV